MLDALAPFVELPQTVIYGIALIFTRVAGTVALLPGFGEQSIPTRIRLIVALCFTIIAWPLILPKIGALPDTTMQLLMLFGIEAAIGTMMGIVFRFFVLALQLAGSIAAQATSLSQILGASATPDPMPAMGNVLVIAGLVLALAAGLHVKAVMAIAFSYDIFPIGLAPNSSEVATWGVARAARAFELAFVLAAPFVIASFAYNLTLGFINRAMPQLPVAFIGAPAITAGGLLILLLSGPVLLTVWAERFDAILANPFETR